MLVFFSGNSKQKAEESSVMKIIDMKFETFLSELFAGRLGRANRKRRPRGSRVWGEHGESLEERQVLSAVSGAVTADVASHQSKHEAKLEAKAEAKAAKQEPALSPVTYPVVAGAYSVTLTAVIDGETKGPYSGTLQLSQNKSHKRIRGEVSLEGFPEFRLTGKFNRDDLHAVKGVAHIPANPGGDIVFRIFAHLDITYSSDFSSFTGHAHRNFFGRDVDVTFSGVKST